MNYRNVAIVAGVAFVIGFGVMIKLRPKPVPKPPPVHATQAYPIAAMYSNMRGTGEPFVIDGAHGGTKIDSANCQEQARYRIAIIDPEKRDRPGRTALRYIRALNDTMTMLAYIPAGGFFVCQPGYVGNPFPPVYGCDTTQFTWQMFRLAEAHHAILYDNNGKPLGVATGVAVDFAQPGFPAALANLAVAWADSSGSFNPGGIFNDGPCMGIAGWWPGNTTDYERQGFNSIEEWDAAYRAGVVDYYTTLRQRLGPDRIVIGNCGPDGPLAANGWMGENHPYQNPFSWAAWDSLLARADTSYSSPEMSFITAPRPRWKTPDGVWHVAPFTDPEVQRRFRFVVGSAALHDRAVGVLVGSPTDDLRGFMPDQWSDWYYSFGSPLGKQQGSRREFSNGTLLVNPTSYSSKNMVGDSTVVVPPMDAMFVPR